MSQEPNSMHKKLCQKLGNIVYVWGQEMKGSGLQVMCLGVNLTRDGVVIVSIK